MQPILQVTHITGHLFPVFILWVILFSLFPPHLLVHVPSIMQHEPFVLEHEAVRRQPLKSKQILMIVAVTMLSIYLHNHKSCHFNDSSSISFMTILHRIQLFHIFNINQKHIQEFIQALTRFSKILYLSLFSFFYWSSHLWAIIFQELLVSGF